MKWDDKTIIIIWANNRQQDEKFIENLCKAANAILKKWKGNQIELLDNKKNTHSSRRHR